MKIPPPPTAEAVISFILSHSEQTCPDCGTKYHGEYCPCFIEFKRSMQSNPDFDDSHNWDIEPN